MSITLEGVSADRALRRLRVRARPAPPVVELGGDLLETSTTQLAIAVARPLAATGAYVIASSNGYWIPAVILVSVVFLTDVCVVHDLMHRSLGLPRLANSMLLGALAVLMLDSGHALQATHHEHHRVFPVTDDDPEAYLAGWSWWRVLAEGPRYRYRLWRWAWHHNPQLRRPLATEMALHSAIIGAALVTTMCGVVPQLGVFVAVGTAGSWLFPLISVTAVHDPDAATTFQQSKTMRGRLVPRLLFGMGYHLEHHFWPTIPAHNLPETARRTTRLLERHYAAITHLP